MPGPDVNAYGLCAGARDRGDDAMTELQGRVVRLRLEGTSVHRTEKVVNFHLWSPRYRKYGLPGKRQKYLVLSTENDLEGARIGRERRSI